MDAESGVSLDEGAIGIRRCVVTHKEFVWNGACGMRPFGKGVPRRPATPVVIPRRKMSQWKPAGFRSGNSVPCAIRDDTK